MKAIPVGHLKINFSTILERVKKGEEVVISFRKKKKKVAVIVPFKEEKPQKSRKLGLLKGKAKCLFKEDFQIRDEESLSS